MSRETYPPRDLRRASLLPPHLLGQVRPRDPSGDASSQQSNHTVDFNLGEPGQCAEHDTLLAIVTDESPSVGQPGGNDPLSRRHDEAIAALRHVAQACRCRREKVAIIPFDEPSPGFVPPQPLTRSGQRRLLAGLHAAPRGLGSSDLGPALTRAERLADDYSGTSALVIFSDFLITDVEPQKVLARVASFEGYVHAVVLGTRSPAAFFGLPHIDVSVITPTSPPGSVARAVFDGLNRYRRDPEVTT